MELHPLYSRCPFLCALAPTICFAFEMVPPHCVLSSHLAAFLARDCSPHLSVPSVQLIMPETHPIYTQPRHSFVREVFSLLNRTSLSTLFQKSEECFISVDCKMILHTCVSPSHPPRRSRGREHRSHDDRDRGRSSSHRSHPAKHHRDRSRERRR